MKFLNLKKYLPVVFLLLITLFLRFYNLGYSDYQGDEIKAFFIPEPNQSASEFLLNQRKGPVQFFVTSIYALIDSSYSNRFFTRFPFAFAGSLAVIAFYKLIELHYNKKVAFYAALFMSINGFFVAFGRIVQYQSFVILFMILSLYFFSLSIKRDNWQIKGIYLGFISWAISLLSHYDGVLIGPFVFFILFIWIRKYKKSIKHLIISAIIFTLMLLSFYVPFVKAISDSTLSYWKGRFEGTGGKISSSSYLFSVYQPIYVIHFYYLIGAMGILYVLIETAIKGFLYKISYKFVELINVLTRLDISIQPEDHILRNIALLTWFFVAFAFMELVVNIPGTHIYTYLVPAFILLGIGVEFADRVSKTIFRRFGLRIVYIVLTTALFFFLFAQSYKIFVEHSSEYPWEAESVLGMPLPEPITTYHLSLFGFPYHRNWDTISDLVSMTDSESMYYSTNERTTISRYYIDLPKDTNKAGYYIYIKNPQSFVDEKIKKKAIYWMDKYDPIYTFIKDGKEVASVYNMPSGSLDEIIEEGY